MTSIAVLTFADGVVEQALRPVFRIRRATGASPPPRMDYADLIDQGYRQVDPGMVSEGDQVYAVRNHTSGSRWLLATISRTA